MNKTEIESGLSEPLRQSRLQSAYPASMQATKERDPIRGCPKKKPMNLPAVAEVARRAPSSLRGRDHRSLFGVAQDHNRKLDVRKSALNLEERLQRHGQATLASGECRRVENLIVIGASAGGYPVLVEIVKDFSVDMPAAIVILLHRVLDSPSILKELLQKHSRLPVIDVESDVLLTQGAIFIPPPGKSATFSDGRIAVDVNIPERPANTINQTFLSAAKCYGEHVIGVILSGLLRDGTEGLRAVHEAGGLTMVQSPQEAEFPDMPTNAMESLPVTFCLNWADIGPALELLVRRTSRFETGLAVAVRLLQDRSALLVRLSEQSWRNPGTREFLKNELTSLRRNLQTIDDLVKAFLAEHAG